MVVIHADGAYNPVLDQGGWAAVVVEDSQRRVFSGIARKTTGNRMEITSALEGILQTPPGSEILVYTDSQYLYGCMAKGWQRRANRDLWEKLDAAAGQSPVFTSDPLTAKRPITLGLAVLARHEGVYPPTPHSCCQVSQSFRHTILSGGRDGCVDRHGMVKHTQKEVNSSLHHTRSS